jgi:TPR repeat protein
MWGMTMQTPVYPNARANYLRHAVAAPCSNSLLVVGAIMMGLAPARALDSSNTSASNTISGGNFANGRQALQVGLDDLKTGHTEASVAALTYAAAHGEPLAGWKLGEMYANGDGVPRDDYKAYHYFDRLVEDYDEDRPDLKDLRAFSTAFVAVGVYCLNGIPNSDLRPDPRRAYVLFQYAATTFGDPNAQYNLARTYMAGVGGVARDDTTAIRWLALAAKQGHSPSQALLGHMLFIGDGVQDQRARGLMWLEFAKDGALAQKDQWIRELYQRDFLVAGDNDRRAAAALYQAPTKETSPPVRFEGSVASFLQPPGALLTASSPPDQLR